MNDLTFYSNKIGSGEFSDVILAAYVLYEMYDEPPGITMCNGDIVNPHFFEGWINHILGTKFSMEKRCDLWKNAEYIAFSRIDYEDSFPISKLRDLISDEFKIAGGTELADLLYIIHGTDSLETDRVVPGSYTEKKVFSFLKLRINPRKP